MRKFIYCLILILSVLCTSFCFQVSHSPCGVSYLPELKPHQEALVEVASDSCTPYIDMVWQNDLIAIPNVLEMVAGHPAAIGDVEFYKKFIDLAFNPHELYGEYTIPGSFADEAMCAWDGLTGFLPITYRKNIALRQSKFCQVDRPFKVTIIHGAVFMYLADYRGVNLGLSDRTAWDANCDTVLRHEIMEYGDAMATFNKDILRDKLPELFESITAKRAQSTSATWSHIGASPIIAELTLPGLDCQEYRVESGEIMPINKALTAAAIELGEPLTKYLDSKELLFKIKLNPRILMRFRAALSQHYAELAEDLANKNQGEIYSR